ncbi:glycosylhydrolase-like jelly roll fold domain-containing protein [uncultured Bacteroides sp.]|uniref:glycosylhydrolase-like jelly roll fold domain-containing protein n=1 Tax=uncultured Bacteroides sp. TaxID=162156 RepID=UPI00262F8EB9|nr:glycosylhydrolase-like jelly roll fold domain-containing protein [uncultured Bacteroides sp.]
MLSDGDLYFISNQSEEIQAISPIFRMSKNTYPELWNPVTGETRPLPEYSVKEGGIEVPLQFDALESAFLVFSPIKGEVNESKKNVPLRQPVATLNDRWEVTFRSVYTTPITFVMDSLTCWTKLEDRILRHHSGEAVYEKSFHWNGQDSSRVLYLDLGNVMVMATVQLNGKYVGGVWTPPYRLRINDYIHPGENKVRITVVNNWMNKLIGDLNLPEKERETSVTVNPWKKDTPSQESGLLGPVQLYSE